VVSLKSRVTVPLKFLCLRKVLFVRRLTFKFSSHNNYACIVIAVFSICIAGFLGPVWVNQGTVHCNSDVL
jgi:isoprenylcysteine carboxyl methyltransferase (ICMT) family protein YpbQ